MFSRFAILPFFDSNIFNEAIYDVHGFSTVIFAIGKP